MHRSSMTWILLLLLGGCEQTETVPVLEHAHLIAAPVPVAEFKLLDQTRDAFSRSNLIGRWTLMFSGFTHCPDVCPTTLGVLHAAESKLTDANAVQMVFVTVDPDRDTPETQAEYLSAFNADWIGLTGARTELDRLLTSLHMAHVRVPTGNGNYTMDHATAVVLIDPGARMTAYWTAPLSADKIAVDLARLPTP